MKNFKRLVATVLILAFCMFQYNANAQEEDEKTPYWYVTYHKLQWNRVDSLQKLASKYTKLIVAQAKKNGTILDYNFLIHHTGSDSNVVIMIKYPSWAAIGEGSGFGKAFKEIEPDKEKRDAISASYGWCFEGSTHTDTIYGDALE